MTIIDAERIELQMRSPRVVHLWRALQPLRSVVSFMSTGAHPDDETSMMLAALGLRDGIHLSYTCSTRGEGGQNQLGREIAQELGMVRTAEMERACDVLNMQLYWLSESQDDPIFDFGFSKNGIETMAQWGKTRTMRRFVEVIRRERPDIICPTFLDVPGQHGHHRAMTQAAHDVIDMAADGSVFPDIDLPVWQVKKMYLPAWSGVGDSYDDDLPPPPTTVKVDASGIDPVTGASWAQIGQQSRYYHKTQGMGRWVDAAEPNIWPLHLAHSDVGADNGSIADNLPDTLAALATGFENAEFEDALRSADTACANAIKAWPDDQKIIQAACEALTYLRKARGICPPAAWAETAHRLNQREADLSRVVALAAGVEARATAVPGYICRGESTQINTRINQTIDSVQVELKIIHPDGWQLDNGTLTVPETARLFNSYPDTYTPFSVRSPVGLKVTCKAFGVQSCTTIALETPLIILPKPSAKVEPAAILFNLESTQRDAKLSITDVEPKGADVSLLLPESWVLEDGTITAPDKLTPGFHDIPVLVDGKPARTVARTEYAHTGPLALVTPAVLSVRTMRIGIPDARIAYVGSGNDRVDHWMHAMGLNVTSLSDTEIKQAAFKDFDTLVVGILAFGTRTELGLNTEAIHDWVHAGGNLMTLYHRPWDNWDPKKTPPLPLTIGKPSLRWRVTDENAAVTHLLPDHPLLNHPNKIRPGDWSDWVKERGLYFASEWDDTYQALISMADPDEAAHQGALLSANIGKGRHTHTGLLLHHQMEKLVPGAFRLMANLVSRR